MFDWFRHFITLNSNQSGPITPLVLPTDPVLTEDLVVIQPVLPTNPVVPEPVLTEHPVVPEPVLPTDPVVPEPVLPTVRSHGRKSDSDESEIEFSSDSDSDSYTVIDNDDEICKDLPNDGFDDDNEPLQDGDQHIIEDEYESDELMSDVSSSEEDIPSRPRFERFKRELLDKDYKFKLEMEFANTTDFKDAILQHSVLNGKCVEYKKNDKMRVRFVCKHKECGFVAFLSKVSGTATYRIKTLNPNQTCGRTFNNKNAKAKWIAKVVEERMKNTSGDVQVKDIINEMRTRFSIGVSWGTAWNARRMAKAAVEGDALKQHTMLRSYATELTRVDHQNSVALILRYVPITLQPRFGSFYMCLEGCKSAFNQACIPFIGIDGCHLKTKYGDILLIVVGKDPNDQYFPLAFAVGLLQVFAEDLPGVEHRFCVRHLYANFKKRFGGGTKIKDLLMWASKAT
ncbi:uncharacterized protein LOC130744744 [Lotus japonicus]|uniref:uncharacterized protein LOC130744744 n=1 Tax=Lotus japonicus TaxID=34305 RepID=UPI002583D50B|nr:uncharacterized protein LOC130744744 [Lotus japonicus]